MSRTLSAESVFRSSAIGVLNVDLIDLGQSKFVATPGPPTHHLPNVAAVRRLLGLVGHSSIVAGDTDTRGTPRAP